MPVISRRKSTGVNLPTFKLHCIFEAIFLHCNYIDCKKHNFLVPFGHLFTVQSTADKWYIQLYFWRKISYHTIVCTLNHTKQCKNISKLFVVFQTYNFSWYFPCTYLQCGRILQFGQKMVKNCLNNAVPERIYNSHYGNGVLPMFTSQCCPSER